MTAKPFAAFAMVLVALVLPVRALAWGNEEHKVIALIARVYLAPSVRAQVDFLLSLDEDSLTERDMASRATWADTWRQRPSRNGRLAFR